MSNKDWDEITVKKNGLNLNKLVSKEFLSDLEKLFEGKKVNCIDFSFIIRDEKIESTSNLDVNIITIKNMSIEDTLTETVYLNSNSKIQELKEILNQYDEY